MDRRDILKAGVGVLAAAAVPKQVSAKESDDKVKPAETLQKIERIRDFDITHGGLQRVRHTELGADVIGQTCIRYLRFVRPARLDRLEIGRLRYGRWQPAVPTHPDHIVVSILDREKLRWKSVKEVNLPFEPEIAGKGLSQDMRTEEMDKHLGPILRRPPHIIELGGLETDHLRIVCDREHPVWPNHGECNGGTHNVPFGILNGAKAYGQLLGPLYKKVSYSPILKQKTIAPMAPKGMRVCNRPEMLLFESEYLSIGFSLRRPVIMHLGWDALGGGEAKHNRLQTSRHHTRFEKLGGASGPVVRTLEGDWPPHLWTGEVSVEGNIVSYRNLHVFEGLNIDATFSVEGDRFKVELTQTCDENIPVVEAEAWRLAWALAKGITGMAAVPTQRLGRNGDVMLPGMWVSDRNGALSCALVDGDSGHTRYQVESYRDYGPLVEGLAFGEHPGPNNCQVIPKGKRHAVFELAVANLQPESNPASPEPSEGLKRHWATVFSCYRPEYRGFSNHSASVNCHLSQGPPIEIVAHTKRPTVGPDPLKLARFTIGKALMDGGGYGYHRNLYLDSDPHLLCAAGRIHQAEPDVKWLKSVEPGLVTATNRILGITSEQGLLICKDLSGNSGTYRWSTNAMDVVGFGHIDAYVNAWAYRALRNAAAMLDDLRNKAMATRCRHVAENLRAHYTLELVNPETGWVAGWRSRDGQLHDYAFTWVNGVAIAFGLLEKEDARKALMKLEQKREEVGMVDARMGIPCNLLPIHNEDHVLPQILKLLQPTFETYTDGGLLGSAATYYLRALSIYGLRKQSRKLAKDLAEGFATGIFNGGHGTGHEFRSWEGMPTGYEGTLIGVFTPLYAIAIEEGVLIPPQPEWWPRSG